MQINEKLAKIQKELKAPKSQYNSFGKYNYRNCEDILEAVKQLLDGLTITLSDKPIAVGDRIYIEATATLSDGENSISVTASAREAVAKKGMDDSQITGSTSSYARKYALNGLFAIDDTKDADSHDNTNNPANNTKGFVLDNMAKQWISAINSKTQVLNDIQDPAYREFIKNNLNQG